MDGGRIPLVTSKIRRADDTRELAGKQMELHGEL